MKNGTFRFAWACIILVLLSLTQSCVRDHGQGTSKMISSLDAKVNRTGSLSETDIDWILEKLKQADKDVRSSNRERLADTYVFLTEPLYDLKFIPPSRKEQLYNVAVKMTQLDNSSGTAKLGGAILISRFKEKRGIPYVRSLLSDQRERVRASATKILAKMVGDG